MNDISDRVLGKKYNAPDFMSILQKNGIFCLQETKAELNIPDYICINTNRPDSRSGGTCIGVHKSIQKYVTPVKSGDPDISGITISRQYIGNTKDLALINVYDSPENSAYKLRKRITGESQEDNVSTLDKLLGYINKFNDCDILLLGDFNARTGGFNHCPIKDDWEDHRIQIEHCISRTSKDDQINERGRKLLELLSSCNLTILNGNIIGDVFGMYTCSRYNGNSVVDYMMISPDLKHKVKSMKVANFNQFSDHRPIFCKIETNTGITHSCAVSNKYDAIPKRTNWEKTKSTFVKSQKESYFMEETSRLSKENPQSISEVMNLNKELTNLIQALSGTVPEKNHLQPTANHANKRVQPKHRWFDSDCIHAKRNLNKLAREYGKTPTAEEIRSRYYTAKKDYRKLLKAKKQELIAKLNSDILDSKTIDWKMVKSLKKIAPQNETLDIFDLEHFRDFFENLYSKNESANQHQKSSSRVVDTEREAQIQKCLNDVITEEELSLSIKLLKNGKAAGLDSVLNEQLKCANGQLLRILLNLFNACLDLGVYPWCTSVVTPLHKKGDIRNPDNYRAIAIGSNLGKLFSTILLRRLLNFRQKYAKDTIYQLGFCQGARTTDHLLTLQTCIEKYIKRGSGKKRLYSCFVDYRKAFDSICRDALIFKLEEMGFTGKFLNCLSFMYNNSKARIKIIKKLSAAFDIKRGTEQGHPMSPELFKIFIHDLSVQISDRTDLAVPLLNEVRCSHLLWADDLVLLALDKNSLQEMINILQEYCVEWGLSVNTDKTAILVFNPSGKLLNESKTFLYDGAPLPAVKQYCYLGICFTASGSLVKAQSLLHQKGLRAYFGMKKFIDPTAVAKEAAFKLFDSLITPVVGYGYQIWMPHTNGWKLAHEQTLKKDSPSTLLSKSATDPIERLHLAYLKWITQLPKRVSNAPIWGDCGRYPIAVTLVKSTVNYLNRLILLDTEDSEKLVRHAYLEQKNTKLGWYAAVSSLSTANDPESGPDGRYIYPNSTLCRTRSEERFRTIWDEARTANRKLVFYNQIKPEFGLEHYIGTCKSYSCRNISLLRTSSHKLSVETGRYGAKRLSPHNRCCPSCTDLATLELLVELPYCEDLIVEDERHLLKSCPNYTHIRKDASTALRDALENEDLRALFQKQLVSETGTLLGKMFGLRFPDHARKKRI